MVEWTTKNFLRFIFLCFFPFLYLFNSIFTAFKEELLIICQSLRFYVWILHPLPFSPDQVLSPRLGMTGVSKGGQQQYHQLRNNHIIMLGGVIIKIIDVKYNF